MRLIANEEKNEWTATITNTKWDLIELCLLCAWYGLPAAPTYPLPVCRKYSEAAEEFHLANWNGANVRLNCISYRVKWNAGFCLSRKQYVTNRKRTCENSTHSNNTIHNTSIELQLQILAMLPRWLRIFSMHSINSRGEKLRTTVMQYVCCVRVRYAPHALRILDIILYGLIDAYGRRYHTESIERFWLQSQVLARATKLSLHLNWSVRLNEWMHCDYMYRSIFLLVHWYWSASHDHRARDYRKAVVPSQNGSNTLGIWLLCGRFAGTFCFSRNAAAKFWPAAQWNRHVILPPATHTHTHTYWVLTKGRCYGMYQSCIWRCKQPPCMTYNSFVDEEESNILRLFISHLDRLRLLLFPHHIVDYQCITLQTVVYLQLPPCSG